MYTPQYGIMCKFYQVRKLVSKLNWTFAILHGEPSIYDTISQDFLNPLLAFFFAKEVQGTLGWAWDTWVDKCQARQTLCNIRFLNQMNAIVSWQEPSKRSDVLAKFWREDDGACSGGGAKSVQHSGNKQLGRAHTPAEKNSLPKICCN